MNRMVHLFMVLALVGPVSFAQKIVVTSPTGGQTFTHGDLLKVRWRAPGLTGKVRIFLVSRSNSYLMKKIPANKRMAVYRIPTSIRPDDYVAVVRGHPATGRSGKFTIRARRTMLNQPRANLPNLNQPRLPPPDLIIASHEIIQNHPNPMYNNKKWINCPGSPDFATNSKLTFKLTIQNIGSGSCHRRFVAQVTETERLQKLTKGYSGTLVPGQKVTVTIGPTQIFTKTAGVTLKLQFYVDAGNLVTESDESNNSKGCTCVVRNVH